MAKTPTTGKAVKKETNSKLSFHKQLVLNRFMFHFFKDGTLQGLKNRLGEDRFEGIHEDGQSLFFHELSNYYSRSILSISMNCVVTISISCSTGSR